MQVSLVMFKADGSRRDFPLNRDRIVIGRKNNCDLRIPLSSVSRQHCEVRLEDDEVKVRDLGSSNGTYHNSVRVQEATLAAGDEVVVGPVVFTVVIDGEPQDIKPVRSLLASQSGTGDQTQVDSALGEANNHEHLPDIEPEMHSPTVDLDDPIAALEKLAEAERVGGGSSGDDDPFDFEIEMDDDEDDD